MGKKLKIFETKLYDKVYGCLLGGAIGDALGGPVEKLTSEEIYKKHGVLDRFIAYDRPETMHGHFGEGDCIGVYTDDTRLKHLYCDAIFQADGIPRTGDLTQALVEAYQHSPDEIHKAFYEEYYLKSIWREDKVIFSGEPTNGAIMGNSPLGLITACRPKDAYRLGFELGWFAEGYAKTAAAMMAAAVSEAMRPQTTVDKIVTAARESHLIFSRRREGKYWQELEWRYDPNISFLDQALDIAREIRDVFKIREPLYNLLEWGHLFSEATHTLVVALSMFVAADGDLEKAIVGAVMYGRDMDSYASVVGALAGAFNGAESIKKDWVRTVVNANPEPDMPQLAEKISRIVVRDEQELRQDLDDLYHLI
jgi:ADP-ribosylglycohydrolase